MPCRVLNNTTMTCSLWASDLHTPAIVTLFTSQWLQREWGYGFYQTGHRKERLGSVFVGMILSDTEERSIYSYATCALYLGYPAQINISSACFGYHEIVQICLFPCTDASEQLRSLWPISFQRHNSSLWSHNILPLRHSLCMLGHPS